MKKSRYTPDQGTQTTSFLIHCSRYPAIEEATILAGEKFLN